MNLLNECISRVKNTEDFLQQFRFSGDYFWSYNDNNNKQTVVGISDLIKTMPTKVMKKLNILKEYLLENNVDDTKLISDVNKLLVTNPTYWLTYKRLMKIYYKYTVNGNFSKFLKNFDDLNALAKWFYEKRELIKDKSNKLLEI